MCDPGGRGRRDRGRRPRNAARRGAGHVSAAPVRVIVRDDQQLVREGVAQILRDAGFDVVANASDAGELVRKARAHRPDVVVTDIRMPPDNTDDGLRAARTIRRELSGTAVLVLSHDVDARYARDLVVDARASRQVRRGLSGSGFSVGSLDRQAKPLLQCVRVDALVVALFGGGPTEEHDALRREGDENVFHRLDRITFTGDTVGVQSGVVEALDRLTLHQLCPSDRLVGVGQPKAQRRTVKGRRHDQYLRVVGRTLKRRAQPIGGNRLGRDYQDLQDIPPPFSCEHQPFDQSGSAI
jgi:CheY-like chemotaxis protein